MRGGCWPLDGEGDPREEGKATRAPRFILLSTSFKYQHKLGVANTGILLRLITTNKNNNFLIFLYS